ncbi:hypothetical protein BCR34DRAFT_473215 [Clohesyomyces aquaticus]|uniref:Tat pathway signal sequence n=1 Tax=Clohesyomyces aquaticus TaxID=1231657 RepID=A0A1Y2A7L8_9PLEO|nr:hypothetical protein BCR34DRAFT_473215 [Clohesyomyces aquaticus]
MASKYTDHDRSSYTGDYEKTAFLNSHYIKEAKTRRGMLWLTFLNLFLFTISVLVLICAIFSQRTTSIHSAAKLMENFNIFSPAMHIVEYQRLKFELPNPINQSKYVGMSEEAGNAWMDITYLPDQLISVDDMPKLQKPLNSLKVTDPRTGETGYRVAFEVFHQLHCLNMLRMATYPDHFSQLAIMVSDDDISNARAHLDNCIETLRMSLMCSADVNVFTFHEKPGLKGSWPDHETHHVCRNFDAIKQWAHENGMPSQDN